MVTVGSVYIQTHEIPSKQILNELLEYLKSVQHPIKGLFLRYYYLKSMKDRLPDTGSEFEGEGGNIDDALSILFKNLSEMNKLWIRLKTKREKERSDLKFLISESISRISNLEGVNNEKYQTQVFP